MRYHKVWIVLSDNRILEGQMSHSVLRRIDKRGIGEGEELQLIIDERHKVDPNVVLPVRDLWVPLIQTSFLSLQ